MLWMNCLLVDEMVGRLCIYVYCSCVIWGNSKENVADAISNK